MKNYFALFFLIILSGQRIFGQSINCEECKYLLDSAIHIMKENATNAKTVDWKKVETEINTLSKNCNSPYELGPSFNYLYKAINDFHGAFFYGDSTFKWECNESILSQTLLDEFQKGVKIKTEILDGQFGYLRIPSMMAFSAGQQLSDSICFLLNQNIKGLIIDLRLDGGGNMYPMILGISSLLTSGKIGSFHTTAKENQDWIIRDNNFYLDTTRMASLKSGCNTKGENLPVVIITSPATGSAAECLIIAFKTRPNTILLGETTAGYVTVNNGFKINDKASLNLSIGYSSDKNGTVYTAAFKPDVPCEGADNFSSLESDKKTTAALNWLKQHKKY